MATKSNTPKKERTLSTVEKRVIGNLAAALVSQKGTIAHGLATLKGSGLSAAKIRGYVATARVRSEYPSWSPDQIAAELARDTAKDRSRFYAGLSVANVNFYTAAQSLLVEAGVIEPGHKGSDAQADAAFTITSRFGTHSAAIVASVTAAKGDKGAAFLNAVAEVTKGSADKGKTSPAKTPVEKLLTALESGQKVPLSIREARMILKALTALTARVETIATTPAKSSARKSQSRVRGIAA